MDVREGFEDRFSAGIGMITSNGKWGENVMSAEWTMQVSYNPPLIAISIGRRYATYENIMETKKFGVNMVADDQGSISHLAGSVSKRRYDKLSDSLFKGRLYRAKKINTPMIEGSTINAECKMIFQKDFGDHSLIIGEVAVASFDASKSRSSITMVSISGSENG